VQDIWRIAATATGAVNNPLMISSLRLLVQLIYRYSSIIVVQWRQFVNSIRELALPAHDIRPPTASIVRSRCVLTRPIEATPDGLQCFRRQARIGAGSRRVQAAIRHLKDRRIFSGF
jgi:hypothetical protein